MTADALFERLELPLSESIADRVVTLQDAVLVPAKRSRSWRINAGLYRSDGTPEPLAQGWHYPSNAATKFPEFPASPFPERPGRFLFLGHYLPQFGHFLLETTARLWHLHHSPDAYDGLVLLHGPRVDREKMTGDIQRFMHLCGWEMPPLLDLREPTRLAEVVVPMQACGALDLMIAAPEYRTMIHERFARDVSPEGPEKIYISRTGFLDSHGSLVEEEKLERLLQAEGYVPFHPQDHSIEVQVATYKAAKEIAAVDGSPLHLLAMVLRPHQRVVIFQRRPAPEVFLQAHQLEIFSDGAFVKIVKAREKGWSPAGIRRAALSVFGMLDFPEAAETLMQDGFISSAEAWTETDRDVQREQLRAIGKALGADMYEVASPRENLSELPLRSHPGRIRLYPNKRWKKRLAEKNGA
ncbi:MAG: glycosyltransferase family 61 protein [Maritimibacter sp.]